MSNQQLVVHQPNAVAEQKQHQSILDLDPRAMANKASEIATVLKDIIDRQKLYSMIGGGKHVRVEGWQTMGSFLGFATREQSVTELPDGSYEAIVELYNTRTKEVVGIGSALCGMDERRWQKAEKYARRSMAITRATGKAYRLSFGWVMALAGYETTPAEEMPEKMQQQPQRPEPQIVKVPVFARSNTSQLTQLTLGLRKMNVNEALDNAIFEFLDGKEFTNTNVKAAIDSAQESEIFPATASEI